jgi:hypothetical protein
MIPIIMMIEMPLPIPLSVIRSPSHMINMEPAVRRMMEETPKKENIEWCNCTELKG